MASKALATLSPRPDRAWRTWVVVIVSPDIEEGCREVEWCPRWGDDGCECIWGRVVI